MNTNFKTLYSFSTLVVIAFNFLALSQLSAQDRLISDRPGFSMSSITMPKGVIQGQNSMSRFNIKTYDNHIGRFDEVTELITESNFRYGLSNRWELDLSYTSFVNLLSYTEYINLFSSLGRSEAFLNTQFYSLGARYQLIRNKELSKRSMNMLMSFKYIQEARATDLEFPSFEIKLSADFSNDKDAFLMNLFIVGGEEVINGAGLTLNYSRNLTKKFTAFSEAVIIRDREAFGSFSTQINLGGNYYISNDFMIDIYGTYGALDLAQEYFSSSPYFQISAGISWNINLKK